MKIIFPLLAALLLPLSALAAGFEGKVTMKLTGPQNAPPVMIFSLKEGFSRIDMSGAQGRNAAVIFDAAKQQMTILMLDQKMYMTQTMPKPDALGATGGGASGAGGTSLETTTTKEKILGYDCVKYVAQSKDGTSEIWVTDQLGAFLGFGGGAPGGGRRGPGGGMPAAQSWEQALEGKGVFPLRVVTSADGKETFRLEATSIEKTALPADAFSAPADFRNLSEMMRGMGMPSGIPGMPGGMRPPGGG